MLKQNKPFKIYTLKLARVLCEQGFRMIGTEPNREKPWLNVFLFENTPELREVIERGVSQ